MESKVFEQLSEVAKSAQSAVADMKKSHVELDGRVAKLQEELASGKADSVSKAAYQEAVVRVEKSEQTLQRINDEVTELAKKMAAGISAGSNVGKTLGQMVAECQDLKNYRGGSMNVLDHSGPAFGKANLTSAANSGGANIQPYRVSGVVEPEQLSFTVRDLFSSVSISTNAIEWVRENVFTNNAGYRAETVAASESGITYTKETTAVATIAHWLPISREVLNDAPQMQGIVDSRMRYGLKLKEDTELLFGNGTGGALLGLVPQAAAFSTTGMPSGGQDIDKLRWAILQVARTGYPTTFMTLSLEKWAEIQMMKTNDGAYIFGSPVDGAAPRLWGKRVVESHRLAAEQFLVGSALAATVYDREQVSVRIAEQHGDFFIRGMVALLCEERIGLTVQRASALVTGSLNA